ncbi:MAG: high-potential iron-sulfur protein [Pseudomarimonas sp.]
MTTIANSRRRFIQIALVASAAPLLPMLSAGTALASDLPPLTLENATAKALNYVETTEGVSHPSFKPNSRCDNCQFAQGAAGSARLGCTLFAGFSVAAGGWCSAWALKAA